jgi:hypothetical protein
MDMTEIADAMMATTDKDRDLHMDRATLRMAVMQAISCRCGRIHDIGHSALFDFTTVEGKTAFMAVYCGTCAAQVIPRAPAIAAQQKCTLKIIDGKVVNATKRSRPRH